MYKILDDMKKPPYPRETLNNKVDKLWNVYVEKDTVSVILF